MNDTSSHWSWHWVPHVFAIELKKALSYRVAFWVQFILGSGTDMLVAFFIWHAIFETRGEAVLEGFTFHGILFYYLFASFSVKIARGSDHGYISQEIYDGGLTRYLVYPLPFFGFKYVTHLTNQFMALLQLALTFSVMIFFIPLPEGHHLSALTILAGIGTCLLTGYLHFLIMICLEMVAFWQDVVWNLLAMMRFTMALMGGASIPLAFFPAWGQAVVNLTPFPSLITFPAKTFLGEVSAQQWLMQAGGLAIWSILFTILAALVWRRGLKRFSGVGL